MIHYFIGNLGHLFVILSFATAILAAISYAKSNKNDDWVKFSNWVFYIHAFSMLGVMVTLFIIINQHYFEYHYAWNYSSRYLPIYYQISSFWNGQEGSFLLWMFWNVILGIVLIHTNKSWRAPVMTVMSITQIFLTSMVLGLIFWDVKIGSSPFLLLRNVIQDPIFSSNPDFVPSDGQGLNPLLQNYWMVIHPPTLFLGFAATVVPFAYCISGLTTGRLREWIRPALPWAQFTAMVLGVGILMGAYWAYETLNFGGYWNWDPVENAIYVPWLVLVAGMHTMIVFRRSESALKVSIILIISTFILILYSTFLTRSGVLGETSVHSFTDLGLSGQLLIGLIIYIVVSVILSARVWKSIETPKEELSLYSREFWIFMGATVLALMAFQVIIPTSIPVINEVAQIFGIDLNIAPPAEQVLFYSKFQLWFAIVLALLSGTGQFFYWKKMDIKLLVQELRIPVVFALIGSSIILLTFQIYQLKYILLLTVSLYSVAANGRILWNLRGSKLKLSGGSITHIGVALMLIGILFSSGYSKILSKNKTGLVWSKEFPDDVNQNNLLLFLNEPRPMEDYALVYKGIRKKTQEYGYIDREKLVETNDPLKLRVTSPIELNGEIIADVGELVTVTNNENSYFEVVYQKGNRQFTLYPRVQINESMDMIVYSPDINRTLQADLYTHVRTFPDPEVEKKWTDSDPIKIQVGERFFINDYAATFEKMERVQDLPGLDLRENDVAVKASIRVQGESDVYLLEPLYIIKDNMAGKVPFESNPLASKISIESIHPEENSFTFQISTRQKDWIILEAVEKPWINILWAGTLLLVIGFVVAIRRRYGEFISMKNKGLE